MNTDSVLARFLSDHTEYPDRRKVFQQLMTDGTTYEQAEFCLRYLDYADPAVRQLCSSRLEKLAISEIYPRRFRSPTHTLSGRDLELLSRIADRYERGLPANIALSVIRCLASLGYSDIVDDCNRLLRGGRGRSMQHAVILSSLALLASAEASAVLVSHFHECESLKCRTSAACLAPWTDKLQDVERDEIEQFLLSRTELLQELERIELLFALAILRNATALSELMDRLENNKLNSAEESQLKHLSSQRLFGVLESPEWRSSLIDWLRSG